MTERISQRAQLFTGADNWTSRADDADGIPSIRFSDGPHGLRIERTAGFGFNESHPSTAYPTASLTACSFDRALQKELGEHLAAECIRDGVQVLLGPGINHKRDPRCGRNFEYYSEDPYLSGELGAAYVNGVQSCGVGVSVKHFAGNSREYGRMVEDSIIDERALHELYLAQFERVIRESRPWSVMCAYNRLNGEYCCQNRPLMSLARDRWGFDGVFLSDWGAVADPVKSIRAGLNLEMPGGNHGSAERIIDAVTLQNLDPEVLDESTERIRLLAERTAQPHCEESGNDHEAFALKAAQESAVLMKNNGALPVGTRDMIALIGPFAHDPRIQGTGSSRVNATQQDSLYEVMKEKRAMFSYAPGYTVKNHHPDTALEEQALNLAERASKVIVMAGLPEGDEAEGYDRTGIALPENQNRLIQKLARINKNVIVVLQCGAPVELPWRNEVNAVLCMYLAGCRSGEAAWNLLSGSVNPCGKLAETWPVTLADVPSAECFRESLLQVQYRESIYTGYRYYDASGIEPAFAFGHGCSYTTYEYHDLTVRNEGQKITAAVQVTNTGNREGKEIVQLYVAKDRSQIARCTKELKGFEKVNLKPGETKTVSFQLDERSFSYYDVQKHDWSVEAGQYSILIGASSRDIRCEAVLFLDGTLHPYSMIPSDYLKADTQGSERFSREAFASILGGSIPPVRPAKPFTGNSSVAELSESGMGKLIRKGIAFAQSRLSGKGVSEDMILEAPVRSIFWVSSHATWDTVDAIADVFNGKSTVLKVYRTLRGRN
ncbi:MAG: glycoside hydrolase family 3 C-terminal domain-containing protein [Solobacterium sp.]|nr:glycoside hydrolase family 3 C-terminal domain-containing protein [Solobacterium sp.]